jgi:hypothetical protein
MKKYAALVALIVLAGCSSVRVQGFVTDAVTHEPVGSCQITIAKRYAHSDPAGHYSIVARRNEARKNPMNLNCKGYEPKSMNVWVFRTRSRNVDVQVTPIP